MEYHQLQLDVAELEKKIILEIIRPERVLLYLVPGRLVCSLYVLFSILS